MERETVSQRLMAKLARDLFTFAAPLEIREEEAVEAHPVTEAPSVRAARLNGCNRNDFGFPSVPLILEMPHREMDHIAKRTMAVIDDLDVAKCQPPSVIAFGGFEHFRGSRH